MVILKKERISISFSLNIQCRYLAHISNPPLFYRAADFLFSFKLSKRHHAACYSQARQNRADDSRQSLQDEFPSLFLHNLPFTILPFTPITPITPIPLPLRGGLGRGFLGFLWFLRL